eukprot:741023-Pelagomonas_calceolata.AAC.1
MSSTWHSRTRPACATSQLQRSQHGTAVTPLPMCEVSAAPEYVRACACTAHEDVTRGQRVEAPHKSPKGGAAYGMAHSIFSNRSC